MTLGRLFDELKRRNVFRVAVAYLVSGWLVLQVVDVVIGNIGAPRWVFSVFLLAGVVFFLPVLFFSWAYELTPEGLKRESEVDRSQSITSRTARKLDLITIAMLVAVVAFVLIERTLLPAGLALPTTADGQPETAEITTTLVDDRSIAVLAFDDLSPGGDQAFFAEGLSEEILNVLAQVPGLKVAGRTSSFAFKGKGTDLREIGEVLNVAHILEGSVRKAGDRIRVTAQLIQASDGFHLFSRTYDRDLDDVFSVQDEIAALIGEALKTELAVGKEMPSVAPTSIDAYDLYLLARQRLHSRNPELIEEAGELLDRALAIDPDYAPALAQRALVWSLLSDAPGSYGDVPDAIAVREGLASVTRALEIDPDLAEAHAVRGLIVGDLPGRREEGIASLRRSLELNPNSDDGKVWLARIIDDFDEAVALNEQVVSRDPLYGPAFNNLIGLYNRNADFDRSEALIERVERISGPDWNVQQARGEVALMRGDLSEAVRHLSDAYAANPNGSVVQMSLGFALYGIGEMDRTATDSRLAFAVAARAAQGDRETVDKLIREADFKTGNRVLMLEAATNYLVAEGRAAEALEIVTENYGNVAALVEELGAEGRYGTDFLGPLALACLQLDLRDERQTILEAMASALDEQQRTGSDNWVHWISRAQYAALTDDRDAAFRHLQTALDRGFVAVVVPDAPFALLADDARYATFSATALARANREREELGLEPYKAPLLFQ